jgi:cell shape-determining protein MreC
VKIHETNQCLTLVEFVADNNKTEREKREIDRLMTEMQRIVNRRDELERQLITVEEE